LNFRSPKRAIHSCLPDPDIFEFLSSA
jgi:hypothetical protein